MNRPLSLGRRAATAYVSDKVEACQGGGVRGREGRREAWGGWGKGTGGEEGVRERRGGGG